MPDLFKSSSVTFFLCFLHYFAEYLIDFYLLEDMADKKSQAGVLTGGPEKKEEKTKISFPKHTFMPIKYF